jgi:hypothetical protein
LLGADGALDELPNEDDDGTLVDETLGGIDDDGTLVDETLGGIDDAG